MFSPLLSTSSGAARCRHDVVLLEVQPKGIRKGLHSWPLLGGSLVLIGLGAIAIRLSTRIDSLVDIFPLGQF